MNESLKLLIVDDNDSRRVFVKKMAQNRGVLATNISEAVDEKGAMTIIQSSAPIDLAIVDVNLTAENAREGFRVIEKLRTERRECIVICISDSIDPSVGADAVNIAGAHDYAQTSVAEIPWKSYVVSRLELWLSVMRSRESKKAVHDPQKA